MSTWECRACGEDLDHREAVCPHCGSADVVQAGAEKTSGTANEQPEQASPGAGPAADTASEASDESGTEPDGTESAASDETERSTGEKALLGGIGLTVLGAFLPWITVSGSGRSVTVNGIDGDGSITAAVAVLVAILFFVRWGRKAKLTTLLLSVLITLIAVLYISDPAYGLSSATQQSVSINTNVGLYVTALGGAAMTYGAYAELRGD